MSVLCAHCGEELMGAVNRCWRCGQSVASRSGPIDIPPLRRAPIIGSLHTPTDVPLEVVVLVDGADQTETRIRRRGSPFLQKPTGPGGIGPATESGQTANNLAPLPRTWTAIDHPLDRPAWNQQPLAVPASSAAGGAQFAALVSVGIGLLGIVVSRAFPIATVCLSMVALGLGVWGLFGPQRRVAVFALLLACSGLAWGGFNAAVQIYQMIYRVHPFAVLPW